MIASRRLPIRFGNFLAPNLLSTYQRIAAHVANRLGYPTEICMGTDYDQAHRRFDVCFICGLAYVELAEQGNAALEPIAAPVLRGKRYGGRPIYFSDVIVRKDSPFRCFADLRDRTWSYNEPLSQSGYGITRYCLAQMGETARFFGRAVQSGWHGRSLQMVLSGDVDASAIDSHILALAFRDRPQLRDELRIIECLGPSTIQPVTVARGLPDRLKMDLRSALIEMADDPSMKTHLARSLIERFEPVGDEDYNDLRFMRQTCQSAGVLTL